MTQKGFIVRKKWIHHDFSRNRVDQNVFQDANFLFEKIPFVRIHFILSSQVKSWLLFDLDWDQCDKISAVVEGNSHIISKMETGVFLVPRDRLESLKSFSQIAFFLLNIWLLSTA